MELKELEKMTVNDLRELAKKYEDMQGVSGMKKEVLIDALCVKLGIEKKHAPPKGIGRAAMKQRIRALLKKRDEALASHDPKALKLARVRLRRAKHHLRDLVELAERGKIKPKADSGAAAS